MTRKTLRSGVVVEVADDVDVPPPQGRPPLRQKPKAASPLAGRSNERTSAPRKPEPPPMPPPAPSVEVQMVGVTSEAILQELIVSRGLTSAFHKACAAKAAKALARDHPRDASAWLELLPLAARVDASGRTVSASAVKQRLLELVMNAKAADATELRRRVARGEALCERERLELRLAELDEGGDEQAAEAISTSAGAVAAGAAGALPAARPPSIEGASSDQVEGAPSNAERVITPSIGDIVPPGERSDGPPGAPLRQARPPTILDVKPEPVAPTPRETVAEEWDRSPGGQAYHAWRRAHPDEDVLVW
jgi:hypothetical protein